MKISLVALTLLSFVTLTQIGFASTSEFAIPTKDGEATLTGQIDFPETLTGQKVPAVIFLSGTGLFDRNALFGNSGTDGDFVFKDLAREVNKLGFAAMRFDYRGVKCNRRSSPEYSNMAVYVEKCIDASIRQHVTPENIREDIETVFKFAASDQGIRSDRISIFGHSEGTYHTSQLLRANRIRPASIHLMGFLAESPRSLIHWQMVDRYTELLFARDLNHDGVLTNDEISAGGKILGLVTPEKFFSKTGSWRKIEMTQYLEKNYLQQRNEAMSSSDTDPFPKTTSIPGLVQASMKWWRMFFEEDATGVDGLSGYQGKIFVYLGDADSQSPGDREVKAILNSKLPATVHFFHGKGHTLSRDPIFGPIEATQKKVILNDFVDSLLK